MIDQRLQANGQRKQPSAGDIQISLGINREAISLHMLVYPELYSNLFGSYLTSLKSLLFTVNPESRATDLVNFITLFQEL